MVATIETTTDPSIRQATYRFQSDGWTSYRRVPSSSLSVDAAVYGLTQWASPTSTTSTSKPVSETIRATSREADHGDAG